MIKDRAFISRHAAREQESWSHGRTWVHLGSSSMSAMRPSNLPLRAGSQLLYLSPGCLQGKDGSR